ncbi:ankyrin repeat-containing domain protein [Melanogaster broomeanus]|nr:ankyrin repeat-containing domain protein [Melanogaster broomeanus]
MSQTTVAAMQPSGEMKFGLQQYRSWHYTPSSVSGMRPCYVITLITIPFQSPWETTRLSMLHFMAMFPSVQMLLDIGLDVNIEATVPDGVCRSTVVRNIPPLIAATRNWNYQEEVLALLVAWGSTVPRDAIQSVLKRDRIYRCKPFIIHILLQHGADVMLPGGNTCLHPLLQNWSPLCTSSDDLLEIVRLLVGAGCNPTAPNDWSVSPFHLAVSSGYIELVQWLVESGYRLPPDAILHAARCDPRYTDSLLPMLRIIFESGVAIDVRDHRGCNTLHGLLDRVAFDVEMAVAFMLLLRKGCDINCQNDEGETPLHLAAQRSNLHIMKLLIDQGAQLPVDIVNHVTQNAHLGGDSAMRLLVYLVQMHGASCQARTVRGNNVLDCLLSEEVEKLPVELFGYPLWQEPIEAFRFLLDNAGGLQLQHH